MILAEFLSKSETQLKDAGIGSPRLDILILLEDALHRERSWILAHPEHEITDIQIRRIERKLARRAKHIPLAYIRGHSEFYGRSFKVNRHTLEPRPESENMITLLKNLLQNNSSVYKYRPCRVADVGTGCGALGITAMLELEGLQADLYDISASALAVAKHNAHLHELQHVHARKMNLLSRPLRPYDVILANLPYVPTTWKINEAALHEPKIAIFGGNDGMDVYRKLFAQLARFTWKPSYVFCEALPPHHKKLAGIADDAGFELYKTDDFIQVFRSR
ncbi:peptide chain release factor N(5)-glutamine methyltransferase [Candidatus Saccharibacteria bacterium]|nr:peptide chain release factor N(5)-glutamine methyltransferase [Candidatus Saccharibacteria bacterium]